MAMRRRMKQTKDETAIQVRLDRESNLTNLALMQLTSSCLVDTVAEMELSTLTVACYLGWMDSSTYVQENWS